MKMRLSFGWLLLALVGACAPAAQPVSAKASGVASAEAVVWPGWVTIALDERAMGMASECAGQASYWALTTDEAGHVVPRAATAKGERPRWDALAELKGCPARVVGSAGGSEALILTCHALHSVTASGVSAIASWRDGLNPVPWSGAALRDATGAAYVSFGRLIGRFTKQAPPQWFTPRSCIDGASTSRACSCGIDD